MGPPVFGLSWIINYILFFRDFIRISKIFTPASLDRWHLNGAVIGMRSVVSDFSKVGEGAIVGEMSLVKNGLDIPAYKVAVGVPVRVIDDVDDRHYAMTHLAKDLYVELSSRYLSGAMVEIPLSRTSATEHAD